MNQTTRQRKPVDPPASVSISVNNHSTKSGTTIPSASPDSGANSIESLRARTPGRIRRRRRRVNETTRNGLVLTLSTGLCLTILGLILVPRYIIVPLIFRPNPILGLDEIKIHHRINTQISQSAAAAAAAATIQKFAVGDARFLTQQQAPDVPECRSFGHEDDISFTLVSQLSHDRLWMMKYHCQRWGIEHPISIALLTEKTSLSVQDELLAMGCGKDQVTVNILSNYSLQNYPVNTLRNMAFGAVKTSHIVYVDADFWTSADLFSVLQDFRKDLLDPLNAFILPAFQLNRQCTEWTDCRDKNLAVMPSRKDDLLDAVHDNDADAFDPTNVGGHGSTLYSDWAVEDEGLLEMKCVKSNRYEPYLVVPYCKDLPPFQPVFTGYGKNKMTWMMQLRRSGYHFWQIPRAFVIHYPHLDSKARMKWNGGPHGEQLRRPKDTKDVDWMSFERGKTDQLFVEFREWLYRTVPDKTVLGKCEKALNDDVRLWVQRKKTTHKLKIS